MTPFGPAAPRRQRLLLAIALIAVTVAATWTGLANTWVQDDLPIIFTNTALHSLAAPWHFFASAYWPAPFPQELYRPLTILLLAVQWAIGHGAPVVFRIGSIVLYAAAVLAVWRLALRFLAPTTAFVAAALFAAHPVHVEAVAVAVNQAELVVALLLTLAVTAWIDRRQAGLPVTDRWGFGLAATLFVALLFKEHAAVLPALLLAAEVTVLARPGIPRLTKPEWRRLIVGCLLILVVMLFIRDRVLAGDTKGTFTAEALVGQGVWGRLLTMLAVVPEWGRLLIWPAHLRADYSPGVILPATRFGWPQALGVALLLLAIGLFVHQRTRRPFVAFGIAWLAIGLGPVHNVLVATGIVLAERTLFLPSIGFVLGGVALLDAWRGTLARRVPAMATAVTAVGVVALLAMGITRSASRQRVWHDLPTLWRQTLIDAPNSYRAHHAFAQILFKAGDKADAELHYRKAIELWPDAWPVALDLADKYRLDGKCWPAIMLYQAVMSANPWHAAGRASYIACLLHVGEYAQAATVAQEGIDRDVQADQFKAFLATADSALAHNVPVGSVELQVPPDSTQRQP